MMNLTQRLCSNCRSGTSRMKRLGSVNTTNELAEVATDISRVKR
jgi:hypothetical protein